MKFLKFLTLSLMIILPALQGCRSSTGSSGDSVVDQKLVPSSLPAVAPAADPGEPQKGFEQEFEGSQNP